MHRVELSRPDSADVYNRPVGEQLIIFLDEHREMLLRSLEDLDEHEVRRELVGSSTTLLGLVKHATFVERVWFQEAVTALPRSELGIEPGPDESFHLTDADSIDSVRAAFLQAVDESRRVVERLGLDAIVSGNRRGPLPIRWIVVHVLRELAQHCGHADIIREQILDARASDSR